jgi:dihydrodipicolinate synthase/N-acetylneuraminate lyase
MNHSLCDNCLEQKYDKEDKIQQMTANTNNLVVLRKNLHRFKYINQGKIIMLQPNSLGLVC